MRRIKKKEENNISTMKTYQMPNKWQYLTCIKVSFSNQNLQLITNKGGGGGGQESGKK